MEIESKRSKKRMAEEAPETNSSSPKISRESYSEEDLITVDVELSSNFWNTSVTSFNGNGISGRKDGKNNKKYRNNENLTSDSSSNSSDPSNRTDPLIPRVMNSASRRRTSSSSSSSNGGGGGPSRSDPFSLLRNIFGIVDDQPAPETPDPSLTFESCAGLNEQIAYIHDHLIFIMSNKDQFEDWGVKPVKGLIFHGPPGSGKTLLAKSLANELSSIRGLNYTFYMRNGTDMFGKYVGQTEKNIRTLFETAKENQPSIIFIDELDGLCGSRDEASTNGKFYAGVVTQFLACMDAIVRGEIIVIGATNRLDAIDPAIKRPGRFDKILAFHLPKTEGRVKILKIHTKKWRNKPAEEDYQLVSSLTVGYTGADLENLCREAFMIGLYRQFPNRDEPCDLSVLQITKGDWKMAISKGSKSKSNVFGNIVYTGEVNPEINLLTSGVESELADKLRPFIREFTQIESQNNTGIKSCLVWSSNERSVEVYNSYVIPSFVNSCDTNSAIAYKMDEDVLSDKKNLEDFITKLIDSKKMAILYVPNLDKLIYSAIKHRLYNTFVTRIRMIRGRNILLLATSSCDISGLTQEFQPLFNGIDRSIYIRSITADESQTFFSPIFTRQFYETEQKSVNSVCNIPELLDNSKPKTETETETETGTGAGAGAGAGTEAQGEPSTETKIKLDEEFDLGLANLLTKTINLTKANEIPDLLNLKAELIISIKKKLNRQEFLKTLDTVLDYYRRDKMGPKDYDGNRNIYI